MKSIRPCFEILPLPLGEGWGEGELAEIKAPSPCPLPEGEGFKATFAISKHVLRPQVVGCRRSNRTGAVAVEFAVMAPILIAIVLGMIEMGRAFEMKALLEVAAREGARFASMDREGMLGEGETSNQKMAKDVKNFLASNGVPLDNITVDIKDHENPEQDFDLDDPDNDLRLFEVKVSVDYSAVSAMPVPAESDHPLSASVVFRNGRSTISQ